MTLPNYDHLLALSDDIGTFEHADHSTVRRAHGYCTDDVARVLIVVVREPNPSPALSDLGRTSFRFVADAQGVTGEVRNRRTARGRWQGRRGVDDCWGRSVWAFGTASRLAPEDWMRQSARAHFDHGVEPRSLSRRSMAFAALGAIEVLAGDPDHHRARDIVRDAVTRIGPNGTHPDWPWPEPRLAYANAALPEVLIAAGAILDRPDMTERGLVLLQWLLERETVAGHLSPTPVGGAGPDDHAPQFDQQPIEVAAIADACARAWAVTGDDEWRRAVDRCIAWFDGDNDARTPMSDPATGGGYDGLQANGPNLNQGAESTLALLSTLQHARSQTPPIDLVGRVAVPAIG
jgi:hypothetical protein